MNPFYLGSFFVVLSAAGFGVMSIFASYAYQGGASVTNVLFWRFLLAALLFFLLLGWKREAPRLNRRQLLALFGLGSVLYTLQSLCFFTAVKYISPSLAALILYTFPIFVAILACVIDKEALSRQTVGAILLSVCGLALVLGTTFGEVHPLGVLLGFGAALFYSVYIILGNRVVKHLPPLATSAFVSLFAAGSFLCISLVGEGIRYDLGGQAWLAISGIVLCSTVLAIGCFFRGLQLIGSTRASVLSTIEPVVTCICSALLFAERLTGMQMLGGLIVLAGAALIVASRGKGEEPAVSQAGEL
ncbi:DMT family transporter [Brevibacillus sp. SYP-B805]|uniref:EamA family transporter n=1 Tax=Brevibacillus sp. SYP-B805 TaxID=1578199 RepID=UPI0013EAB672|nr:DMT family transporter [Brevibacillus sp. SYP-B805]